MLASRPIRNVLRWQGLATLAGGAVFGVLGGATAAWSAVAGGAVPLVSTVVYAVVVGLGKRSNAGAALMTMLRAEGAKIAVILVGLFAVLHWYPQYVAYALFSTFVASVLLFSVGILAREATATPGQ
jgi:F0F1-type ATP synthase assembly protein I